MGKDGARRETAESGAPLRPKVFVSYSRKDIEFAEQLVTDLTNEGFEAFLDTQVIGPGEPWKERLGSLITKADAIAFILSPDSVDPKSVCDWELNEAERLQKRIIPVVCRPVPDTDVPGRLRRLNYVFMTPERNRANEFPKLVEGLRLDIRWIRQHSEIGEAAERWASSVTGGEHVLLRGPAIGDAERWISSRPIEAPAPTETQRAFVLASREAELARHENERATLRSRQHLLISTVALLSCLLIGIVGWANRSFVEKQIYWARKVAPFVLSKSAESKLSLKDTFRECADCPDMVVAPLTSNPKETSGSNRPQSWLAASKYEVTFENWDICVSQGGCLNTADDENWGREQRPVINVSWQDAVQYVEWLSQLTGRKYRLLASSEWDQLAHDVSKTVEGPSDTAPKDGVGEPIDDIDENEQEQSETESVGQGQANALGFYGFEGNVSEWVSDCFKEAEAYGGVTSSRAPKSAECDRRVIRGDSWKFDFAGRAPDGKEVFGYSVSKRSNYIGLRVARELAGCCK